VLALLEDDPAAKVDAVRVLQQDWSNGTLTCDSSSDVRSITVPGRPERPRLVSPAEVPKRKAGSTEGRIRLVHAIAHIEFNAINLALDAVYRFRDMPDQYYSDWLQVAREEALHFSLLEHYLLERGSYYGEFSAHNGLWEMAVKTDADVLVRMALVPRVLEARGLDVTPTMIAQLQGVGDEALVDILKIIFHDEIGHVRIGNHWYHHCCRERGLEPTETFFSLLDEYMGGPLPGPFETEARLDAGFTHNELELLNANTR